MNNKNRLWMTGSMGISAPHSTILTPNPADALTRHTCPCIHSLPQPPPLKKRRLKKVVGTVYTSTTLGTFPGLYIGTFPLSVDRWYDTLKIT
jgi:hypothetical protein